MSNETGTVSSTGAYVKTTRSAERWIFIFWLLFATCVGFVVVNWLSPVKLIYVATESIEVGVYTLDTTDVVYERGAEYCFNMERPEFFETSLNIPAHHSSCKYLIGMPGDRISVEGDVVTVHPAAVQGDPQSVPGAQSFKRLKSVRGIEIGYADLPSVIPPGFFYFGSQVTNGLDSRYLGVISQEAVIGRATLLIPM